MADALSYRSITALRMVLFVVLTGSSCVLMTGLPEVVFPGFPDGVVMVLKATMGPLSAAVALNFLGIWLGGMSEDPMVYRITSWGSGALFLSAVALALTTALVSSQEFHPLLRASAAITLAAALLGVGVSIRAAMLGDPLARWMVLAWVCMAGMVAGLYLRGLRIEAYGLGTWILTAACTLAYFLIVSMLVVRRIRDSRRLAQLARLTRHDYGADPATGLPTGSVLLSKVEHAFWRTARFRGECTVVCLYLSNLYELGDLAGHGVEHQILAAMAARIRQAAGFRCVVGLYHPRCFVVVIWADKRRQYVHLTITRLKSLAAQPLSVVGMDGARHDFTPRLGVGVVTPHLDSANPMDVINDAERLALALARAPRGAGEDTMQTVW
jgi:GGDEF domain-containing protein